MSHMWKVLQERPRPHGGRLSKQNSMHKLSKEVFRIFKNLPYIQKEREANHGGDVQMMYNISKDIETISLVSL